jgi:hypothetical protein
MNTNGDIAIISENKAIYEWHLTHKSESNYVFTSNSIDYAVKNKDIILVTQLIDFGVIPIISETIVKCTNIEIINLLFPLIKHDLHRTKGYLYNIIHNILVFEWYYDNNHLNDEIMHDMIEYIDIAYDCIIYASNKGYKWSIRYCGDIIQDKYIDIIKILWRNGNNTSYIMDKPLIKHLNKTTVKYTNTKVANNLYWSIYKSVDHELYRLIVSIDPIIAEILAQHILIDSTITKYMNHQNYVNVMEYILSNKVYNHNIDKPYFILNKLNRHHYINIIINCVNVDNPDKTLIDIINNEKKEYLSVMDNINKLEMLLT